MLNIDVGVRLVVEALGLLPRWEYRCSVLNLDRGDFCIGSSLSIEVCRELVSGLKPLLIAPEPILIRREGSCRRFLRASVSMFELLEEVECDQRLILRLAIDLASSTSLPLRLFDDNAGIRKSEAGVMPF